MMNKYRARVPKYDLVDAKLWIEHGDHPKVEPFKDPLIDGDKVCRPCGYVMEDHGRMDNRVVCHGSYVVYHDPAFYPEYEVMPPSLFNDFFEACPVSRAKAKQDKHEETIQKLDKLLFDEVPANSIGLEQYVLGCLLVNSQCVFEFSGNVGHRIFYRDSHKKILDAMGRVRNDGFEIDIVNVSNKLDKMGLLECVGGRVYINDLALSIVDTEDFKTSVDILENYAKLREKGSKV